MAVAAASFSRVTDWILLMSRSYTFSRDTSNPSRIKVGRLTLLDRLVLLSTSPLPLGRAVDPRTLMLGNTLGLEPARLFCAMLKDGSNTCMLCRKFWGLTFFN